MPLEKWIFPTLKPTVVQRTFSMKGDVVSGCICNRENLKFKDTFSHSDQLGGAGRGRENFWKAQTGRKGGNGLKYKERLFRSDIGNKFFPLRVGRPSGTGWPREAEMDAPSLELSKPWLDGAWGQPGIVEDARSGTRWILRSPPIQTILGFCDTHAPRASPAHDILHPCRFFGVSVVGSTATRRMFDCASSWAVIPGRLLCSQGRIWSCTNSTATCSYRQFHVPFPRECMLLSWHTSLLVWLASTFQLTCLHEGCTKYELY